MTIYSTRPEAIEQLILPALGEYAADYDIDAIADAILDYDPTRQGFYQTVSTEEFWAIAAQHDTTA